MRKQVVDYAVPYLTLTAITVSMVLGSLGVMFILLFVQLSYERAIRERELATFRARRLRNMSTSEEVCPNTPPQLTA